MRNHRRFIFSILLCSGALLGGYIPNTDVYAVSINEERQGGDIYPIVIEKDFNLSIKYQMNGKTKSLDSFKYIGAGQNVEIRKENSEDSKEIITKFEVSNIGYELSKNTSFKPSINTIILKFGLESKPIELSVDKFLQFYNLTWETEKPSLEDFIVWYTAYSNNGLEVDDVEITFIYDDYTNGISGTVTDYSNLEKDNEPVIEVEDMKVGESKLVDVPIVEGYTANKEQIKVTVNLDGSVTTDNNNKVIYTKIMETYAGTGEITSPVDSGKTINVGLPTGDHEVGDIVKVTLPQIGGYTATTDDVYVKVIGKNSIVFSDGKGNELTDLSGFYTKNKVPNPGNNNKPDLNDNIENQVNYLTVHPTTQNTKLYNNLGKLISNRALASNTSWYSDKVMIKGNVKYYRVAQNEWIKADDVYSYQEVDKTVTTKMVLVTSLVNSLEKRVNNRGLGQKSSWKTDKLATINGSKYYRVSTNEFVKVEDVTE